jgi:hypothetical protein
MKMLFRYGVAAILVVMVAGLVACGRGSDDPSTSVTPPSSATSDEQIMAIVRELTQCLRDNGIADAREPTLVDGQLQGGGVPQESVNEAAMEAANRACQPVADRLPEGIWGDDGRAVTAEHLEKLGQFAQCLRENGLPEWPDPASDGGFPISGTPLEQALKSDAGKAAAKECRTYYDGEIKVSKQNGR